MNIPGMGLLHRAEQKAKDAQNEANRVPVPLTQKLGMVDFAKQLFKELGKDHTGAFAGNLAYNALFAIFPFMVFLISLLGIFHATGLVDAMIKQAATTMPHDAIKLLTQISHSITKSHSTGAFTVGAIVAIVVALWGVSGAFRAVMDAMNVMYEVKETRPFWKVYLISIVMSVLVTALMLTAVVLVVFGPSIGGAIADRAGLGEAFRWTWNILQWPVLVCFVLFAFALVYYYAPSARQKFRFITPGSATAVAAWLLFSLLFSLYVAHFGSYNKTYGTLAGVVLFLLYMYYSAFILLIGAEMNQIIEAHAPGGKDPGEKVPPEDRGKKDGSAGEDGDNPTLRILRENRPKAQVKNSSP